MFIQGAECEYSEQCTSGIEQSICLNKTCVCKKPFLEYLGKKNKNVYSVYV